MKSCLRSIQKSGMSSTPIYRRWCDMRARCQNPSHQLYKWYGARGINVCAEWGSFLQFYSDMGAGYQKGLQLDRIDNSKGYSKDNCRWAPAKVNNRNRRSNRIVETPNGPMVLAEAAEIYGIDPSLISYRLRRGFSTEQTFAKIDYRAIA